MEAAATGRVNRHVDAHPTGPPRYRCRATCCWLALVALPGWRVSSSVGGLWPPAASASRAALRSTRSAWRWARPRPASTLAQCERSERVTAGLLAFGLRSRLHHNFFFFSSSLLTRCDTDAGDSPSSLSSSHIPFSRGVGTTARSGSRGATLEPPTRSSCRAPARRAWWAASARTRS